MYPFEMYFLCSSTSKSTTLLYPNSTILTLGEYLEIEILGPGGPHVKFIKGPPSILGGQGLRAPVYFAPWR